MTLQLVHLWQNCTLHPETPGAQPVGGFTQRPPGREAEGKGTLIRTPSIAGQAEFTELLPHLSTLMQVGYGNGVLILRRTYGFLE